MFAEEFFQFFKVKMFLCRVSSTATESDTEGIFSTTLKTKKQKKGKKNNKKSVTKQFSECIEGWEERKMWRENSASPLKINSSSFLFSQWIFHISLRLTMVFFIVFPSVYFYCPNFASLMLVMRVICQEWRLGWSKISFSHVFLSWFCQNNNNNNDERTWHWLDD